MVPPPARRIQPSAESARPPPPQKAPHGGFHLETLMIYMTNEHGNAPELQEQVCETTGVASPVTTNHAAKGSLCVNLRNAGNLKIGPGLRNLAVPHLISARHKFASPEILQVNFEPPPPLKFTC